MAEKFNEIIEDYNGCNEICPHWKGIDKIELTKVINYGSS